MIQDSWLSTKTRITRRAKFRGCRRCRFGLRGVLAAEDTELAVQYGCDGVVVSNHGGRQLDGVPATIDALPECVEVARKGGIGVHVDGSVRSGNDLFKALALGAECCWVGSPAIWGLAVSETLSSWYVFLPVVMVTEMCADM